MTEDEYIETTLHKMNESFKRNMERIRTDAFSREDGKEDYYKLVRWILSTEISPYSFMPKGWGGCVADCTAFAGFLSVLHHAMYDDGCLSLVVLNDQPRMSFADYWKDHDDFIQMTISDQEKQLMSHTNDFRASCRLVESEDTLVFVNSVDEWINLCEEHHISELKAGYAHTTVSQGKEFADAVYCKYRRFSDDWVNDPFVKKEMIVWGKIFNKVL